MIEVNNNACVDGEIIEKKSYVIKRSLNSENKPMLNNGIILYGDIDYSTINPPVEQVFQLDPKGKTYCVVCPESFVNNKSNLKFYRNGIEIPTSQTDRTFITGRNQCPNSIDWVSCFRALDDNTFDPSDEYRVEWNQRKIVRPVPKEEIFDEAFDNPIVYGLSSNDVYMPELPDPYTYEIWRFTPQIGGTQGIDIKKAKGLKLNNWFRQHRHGWRLLCRADIGRYLASDMVEYLTTGMYALGKGLSAKYRKKLFAFAIYNTETGARSELGNPIAMISTDGVNYALRPAFRKGNRV